MAILDDDRDSLKALGRKGAADSFAGVNSRQTVNQVPTKKVPAAAGLDAVSVKTGRPEKLVKGIDGMPRSPGLPAGAAGGVGMLAGGNNFVQDSAERGNFRKEVLGDANAIHGRDDLPAFAGAKPVAAVGGAGATGEADRSTAVEKQGVATEKIESPAGELPAARAPRNGDPLAQEYLSQNSRATSPDGLNINNTEAVPGLEGVSYAGRYGKTDVFAGRGEENQRSFADLPNLAAVTGGAPAAVPPGPRVISNTGSGGFGVSTVDLSNVGAYPSQGLSDARRAAADRGDFAAVERSYMTSAERAEADRQSELAKLRAAAIRKDPVAAYEAELAAFGASSRSEAQYADKLYSRQRDAAADKRAARNQRTTTATNAMKILKDSMPEFADLEDPTSISMDEYEGIVGSIVQERPELLPDQVAAEARRMLGQYGSIMGP